MSTPRTMYEWFAHSARSHPDLTALSVGGVDYSYGQLRDTAAAVAGDILAGGQRPQRIAILATRTAGAYLGYLAGLHLGITVVPLNADFPPARNAKIIQLAGADLVLYSACDEDLAAALHESSGVRQLAVREDPSDLPATLPPPRETSMQDLSYIVFTSGSTGTPKGVPIRHRNVTEWLAYVIELFEAGPGVRISQTSDLSWDVSVWNIFVAWGSGGTVVVPSKIELLTPTQHINEQRITHWFSTPSIITLSRMLGDLAPDSMPTLRWSMFAGELLTADNALAWREAAPQSVIANVYGPTEITCTCMSYRLPDDPAQWPRVALGALPLGIPYSTVEYLVVGEDGTESDEGELLFRGPQRLDSYLDPADNTGRFAAFENGRLRLYDGTEELTAAHWYRSGDRVRMTDGRLAFLGRVDNQVKVQGYRVELGEIEASIREHERVDEAVVVLCTMEDGAVELAAFYTGDTGSTEQVLDFLQAQLPRYMVPRFLVGLDKFPLTTNGKIDRGGLAKDAIALADTQDNGPQRLAG